VREAIAASGAPVVAVTPIVGGAPIKGPADHLLRAVGAEVSARGVARLYRGLAGGFVLDARDAAQLADVEAQGVRAPAGDAMMRAATAWGALARAALERPDALR